MTSTTLDTVCGLVFLMGILSIGTITIATVLLHGSLKEQLSRQVDEILAAINDLGEEPINNDIVAIVCRTPVDSQTLTTAIKGTIPVIGLPHALPGPIDDYIKVIYATRE